jgi:sterol 3beta-glucosyltransferase
VLRGRRILCAFSPTIVPPPHDWPASTVVTGGWFLPAPANWQPPAALSDFLQAGPPPVYIGFGSMADRNAEATTRLVLEAVQLAGLRAVLASGWGGLQASQAAQMVYMLEQAPHDWLFPRMAGVVHHGGAGTTAAGLRAGVAGLAVPHFGDQFFWGRRIAALGAGPPPLPRRKLTAPALAGRLRQLVATPAYASRAAALGQAIRAEDGLGEAVRIIQALVKASL